MLVPPQPILACHLTQANEGFPSIEAWASLLGCTAAHPQGGRASPQPLLMHPGSCKGPPKANRHPYDPQHTHRPHYTVTKKHLCLLPGPPGGRRQHRSSPCPACQKRKTARMEPHPQICTCRPLHPIPQRGSWCDASNLAMRSCCCSWENQRGLVGADPGSPNSGSPMR
jgi:hypothetical protein